MDKVTFDLPQSKWGTLKSKYKPETRYVTSDEFTAGSYNFITNIDGSITKRPTDVLYNPTPLAAVAKDQFEAIFSSGVHHLLSMVSGTLKYSTGDGVVTTAKAGYTANANMEYTMYQNRVYYDNGVDNPAVYDLTTSYGGVTYTFPTQTIKDMGCQVPASAPTFAADSGTGLTGSFHYKITYIYYGFEESNGSAASTLHTVTNKTINLTAIPIGGYGVTARNIYRDANDGNYVLVGTLSDNTTTTYSDSLSAGTTAIPTFNNVPPVFSYIALNLSRLWVAGVSGTPTTLYWSLPGLPDIFDPDNAVLCNPKDPIQAVFIYQGTTYVFNRHSFGRILGTTDDTFYYDEFPGSVGCVDNRSLQVRTINGVPTLIWLSDRGFYAFNGSSADYISDPIEDLVNLNIQQVNFVTGSNNQSTLADFQAGTASAGIDLLTSPGTITTVDTARLFQAEADWDGGSSLTNCATKSISNQLQVPTFFGPTINDGSLGGSAFISAGALQLPTAVGFTGELSTNGGFFFPHFSKLAYRIIPADSGFITGGATGGGDYFSGTFGLSSTRIYSDAAGVPGSDLGDPTAVHLSGGSAYWIVGVTTLQDNNVRKGTAELSGGKSMYFNGSAWVVAPPIYGGYFFNHDAHAASGTWTSSTYDSHSSGSAVSDHVTNSAIYATSTGATLFVDMSNDATMSTGVTTFSQADPNGTYSTGLTGKRYWRLRYTITTSDNRRSPLVGNQTLFFNTTGTWISQAIDCTTDVVSYNAITITDDVPAGTTVTVTVATSTDNVSYSSYTAIGSAVVHRYIKIKIVLTTSSDNANTPGVSLLRFSWNLSSNFVSSIINVGQTPSGWGLFQDVAAVGAGTVTFYMRTASSSGGIPGATFYAVSNGNFPPVSVAPNQYVQWKVVITTTDGTLPTVDSVTINWFLGNNQSPIRTASLFYDKTYYLAAAETNQTTNNIVICYDQEGNWRLFRGLTINSLGLFFNQPFYLDSVRTNIYQWLVAANGLGSAITMDVRTKAFDMGEPLRLKYVRGLIVTGMNTGTTIHAYYSVDRGVTWIEMLNSHGSAGYVTGTDLNKFNEYFVPSAPSSGVTIMFRVTSSDAFPCSILTLKPQMIVRNGKYLGRPL